MAKMSLLINAWDTLGWVYFKFGVLPTAEKYIHAAWMMSQHEVQGEHLGQIYEKLGRTQEAIRYYAMSAREYFSTTNGGANDLARTRLVKLVGQQRAQALRLLEGFAAADRDAIEPIAGNALAPREKLAHGNCFRRNRRPGVLRHATAAADRAALYPKSDPTARSEHRHRPVGGRGDGGRPKAQRPRQSSGT